MLDFHDEHARSYNELVRLGISSCCYIIFWYATGPPSRPHSHLWDCSALRSSHSLCNLCSEPHRWRS